MTHDIQAGDVWRSRKGHRLVTVNFVGALSVEFCGAARSSMTARPENFVRGRVLWERGGVRIGDVRQDHVSLRVDKIERDHAGCMPVQADGDGVTWIDLCCLTALPLLERDGLPVTPPGAP